MATTSHTISLTQKHSGRRFVLVYQPGNELLAMREVIRWLADPELPFFVPDLEQFADRIYANASHSVSDQPPGTG